MTKSKVFILFLILLINSFLTINVQMSESSVNRTNTLEYIYPLSIRYGINTPLIDGKLNNFVDEWSIYSNPDRHINFDGGAVYIKYDKARMYFLLDVYGDTVEDNDPGVKTPSDLFTMVFDLDQDRTITPNVDKRFTFNTGNNILYQQYFTGSNSFSSSNKTFFSKAQAGFGCSLQDKTLSFGITPFKQLSCNEHRFYEVAIDLYELGINNWRSSTGFGFTYSSPTPAMDIQYPSNLYSNFTNLVTLRHYDTTYRYTTSNDQSVDFIDKSGNDLQSDVEVYQAVQNYYNGLQLVAGKDTVARVYVETNGPGDTEISSLVYLYGEKNGVALPESPLVQIMKHSPLTINKSLTESSANFNLPDSWVSGNLTLSPVLVDPTHGTVKNGVITHINYVDRRNPVVFVVRVNTGTIDNPILGPEYILDRTIGAFKAMFPSVDVTVIKKPWTTIGACTGCNFYQINDRLESYYRLLSNIWSLGLAGFDQFPDQVYGFSTSGGGLAYPTWWNNHYGKASSGFWGGEGVMIHEINHNLQTGPTMSWGGHVFNFTNDQTPFGCGTAFADPQWPIPPESDTISRYGINVYGWDTRSNTAIPSNMHDVMSYCRTPDPISSWVSGYRWNKWISLFPGTSSSAYSSTFSQNKLNPYFNLYPDHFMISTSLNNNNTGSIDSLFIEKASIFTALTNTGIGSASIQLFDKSNGLIDTYYFNASFTDIDGEPLPTITNNLQIPYYANANKIVLRLGSTIIDELTNYNSLPSITIENPTSSSVWDSNIYDIKWTANDTGTNDLTAVLSYSSDNGATWTPISNYLKNTNHFLVDSTSLEGSTTAKIRVKVSNGFNITYKDSEAFTVVNTPPTINITNPLNETVFQMNETILLNGQATDFNGETIPDNNTYWKIDGELYLFGKKTTTSFQNGTHAITFGAIDKNGVSSEQTFHIFVGSGPATNSSSDNYFDINGQQIDKNIVYGVVIIGVAIVVLLIFRKIK